MGNTLYDRWLRIARNRADERAVCEGGQWITFGELAERLEKRETVESLVIARTGGADFFVEILRSWRDGQAVLPLERAATEPVLAAPAPDGVALVKYTPGAAGVPRGIWFSPEAVAADGDRITAAMGLRTEHPNIGVVSLAHSYGFSSVVLPLLLHGVPVVLADSPFPAVMEEAVAWAGGSVVLPAVPSMWRAWLRTGRLKNWPVRLAVSAGSPLPLELERSIYETTGLKVHDFYGASECGAIAWDDTATPRTTEGGVGKPLPGVCVRILDGRIEVASDAAGTGYDQPRDGDALGGGRYLTRDTGFVENGVLILSGKLTGAINVAGRKVSPAKVERAILDTGLAVAVKVTGFASHDPERCEEIAAHLTLREGATVADLKRALAEKLPLWEVPRKWETGG